MRIRTLGVIALLSVASPVFAQYGLEGTAIVVKLDLPASSEGVDVRPGAGGVDFRKLNDRLRRYGVGVHTGDSIMITKVVAKKDHVEVQLGGGGFGTFADRMAVAAATPTVPYEFRSRRERDLERDAKYAWNYEDRREARRDLEDERRDRRRDNVQAAVANAQTRAMVEQETMMKRAGAGSRFNIWYPGGVPPDAATPDAILAALSDYVSVADGSGRRDNRAPADGPARETSTAGGSVSALSKGMTVAQVESLLGPAEDVRKDADGRLEVVVRQYATDGQQVTARFVGGVLVDYTIAGAR
ncbi:hypothetical protein [Luteitalea sp.]